MSITGLPPRAVTTVIATADDDNAVKWSSSAQFTASASGTVSLDQASSAGSYIGRDPMGLFDLMLPAKPAATDSNFYTSATGYIVTLRARVGGKYVAISKVDRRTPDVDSEQFRPATSGFYGELYLPRDATSPKPAVLVFGGSEGGLASAFTAQMLAAHGYPALALAYFAEPGLPKTLSDIPLEYFTKALKTLRGQPGVDQHHVLVLGVSRGSEAALLLGAHFPSLVNGVVAGVPSSVVNRAYPDDTGAAWTLAGKPIPAIALGEVRSPDTREAAARIPVERIRGPVFSVCGQDDGIWPSCKYAAAITARLRAHHFRYQQIALSYVGAGHYVGSMICCFSATPANLGQTGGTIQDTQAGQRDAWGHLLAFLDRQ